MDQIKSKSMKDKFLKQNVSNAWLCKQFNLCKNCGRPNTKAAATVCIFCTSGTADRFRLSTLEILSVLQRLFR